MEIKTMKIDIISLPICKQCSMVKKLLDKYNCGYTVDEHDIPSLDEYPLVVIDGTEYSYHSFLKFVKNWWTKKKMR